MQRWVWLVCAACGAGAMTGSDGDAPGNPGAGEPAELAGITAAHNQARAMVNTTGVAGGALPALAWDGALAATAAAWVARCQDADANGLVDHNPDRSTGHPFYVGENIYASTGTASGADAVAAWVGEAASYHYATNTCDGGASCGHYTQVVWRGTQKVGCARGACPALRFPSTIVCDYGPGGNVNGQPPY
jgi:pathogenesis-related protein 1